MKRLFPRICLTGALITSFLFLPFNSVYADGLSQDSEYWKWWYIKHTTEEITDGEGASADNLTDTYNGSTVGQYVYDQTGLTADDVKDYVQQQYDNFTGYVEHTVEWYCSAIDDIWNSSIDVGTKAKYQAEKALRETIDTAGNIVVNVSSSSYWSNVYNDLFNSGAYKDQYATSGYDGYNATSSTGIHYNINYVGIGDIAGNYSEWCSGKDDINANMNNTSGAFCFSITNTKGGYAYFKSKTNWGLSDWQKPINIKYTYSGNEINVSWQFEKGDHSGYWTDYATVLVYGETFVNGETSSNPVLQPKQVGFVMHNGIKYPVYTDPSLNPFKVNDNGTVTFDDNGEDEPIFVDPSQLPDTLDILEYLDNDDHTQNPYNPFGKPWNTNDDGSALGGFFSNLIKDIGSVFEGLGKLIENLIDKIIKAITGILDIIVNAIKKFFELFLDFDTSIFDDIEIDNNFGVVSELYHTLLEILGVE